jgi:hypothetical protein
MGKAVANGQYRVGSQYVHNFHVAPRHTDDDAAHDVHRHDHEPGHRVPTNKFRRTVHGPIEVGFSLNRFPSGAGLFFIDQPRVHFGVHGHLFSGHGVQGKPGGHFRHAFRPFGDHEKLHDHKDQEDHKPHHRVPPHHHFSKSLHHRPRISRQQNQLGGGQV